MKNLTTTDLRYSLKPESLSNLMMILIERPTSDFFDNEKAFQVWTQVKAIRI